MNGAIIPVDDIGEWTTLVDTSDFLIAYRLINKICYMKLVVRRAAAVSGSSWTTAYSGIPYKPSVSMYFTLYSDTSQFLNAYIGGGNNTGTIEFKGNRDGYNIVSFPIE